MPVAEKKDQRVVRPRRKDSSQKERSPDTAATMTSAQRKGHDHIPKRNVNQHLKEEQSCMIDAAPANTRYM